MHPSESPSQPAVPPLPPPSRGLAWFGRRLRYALLPLRFPYACLALMAVQLVLFCGEEAWGGSAFFVTLKRMGAAFSGSWFGAEAWRWLSAGYLHMGWQHLLLNWAVLLLCGMYLEGLLGPQRLFLLYTLGLLVTNACVVGFFPKMLVLGASGGIFTLLGALLVLASVRSPWWWPRWRRIAPVVAVLAAGVSTFYSGCECGQASSNTAHITGAVLGMVLALSGALTWQLLPREFSELYVIDRSARAAVWGTVACMAWALGVGRPWELREAEPLVRVEVPGTPISFSVPRGAAAHVQVDHPEEGDGWVSVILGESLTDPLVVELIAERLEEPVAPEDVEEATRTLREELYEKARGPQEEGVTLWMPPMMDRLYTRPAVYSSWWYFNLYWVQRWVMYRGSWHITLNVIRAPGMPRNWEAVESEVSLSLVVREEGDPPWDSCAAWNEVRAGVCPPRPW